MVRVAPGYKGPLPGGRNTGGGDGIGGRFPGPGIATHEEWEEGSAYGILKTFFESVGIEFEASVRQVLREAMEHGYTPDQMDLFMPDLQETRAFKARFPGWKKRLDNGYNQLSIGEYIELEDNYHRIMQENGLPAGFYDDPSDFGNWIAQNVSPEEIQSRVAMATDAAKAIDPTARRLMGDFYGLTTGDIASYFLDQDRALPVIERQFKAANIGAAAQNAGLDVDGMERFENLADKGVTIDQARKGYGAVADLTDTVGRTASVYGEEYDQGDAEDDVFFEKNAKRRDILTKETATASGTSAGGSTGQARRQSY